MLARYNAVVVYPSIRLSVTRRYCTKTTIRKITQTMPYYDTPGTLSSLMPKITHLVTRRVWPHQPENPLGKPRAWRISPWRSPSLFPLYYSNTL